jgi:hypothetical protein
LRKSSIILGVKILDQIQYLLYITSYKSLRNSLNSIKRCLFSITKISGQVLSIHLFIDVFGLDIDQTLKTNVEVFQAIARIRISNDLIN